MPHKLSEGKTIKPYLVMIIPPLLWAGNFIVGKAVADQHAPIGLSFWRWLLASVIFLPFAIKSMWLQKDIIKRDFWQISVLALLSVSLFNSLAYISLLYTTATNATLLNSFIPIFILLITSIFFGEQISFRQILGVIISLLGVLVILVKLNMQVLVTLEINKGDLWMLLAALVWALYSILLKYLRPKELSSVPFLGILLLLGTIMIFPIWILDPFQEQIILNNNMIMAFTYIAIFPSIISYLAWNYGMKKLGASVGGQFIHLMPLFGAIMAVFFLGETIELYHLVGGLLIGTGLWLGVFVRNFTK
ncbi:MAG: DMT family transporter [Sulfurovum sp.]|nr:DMT family transporter [Sulfurovum sp.]